MRKPVRHAASGELVGVERRAGGDAGGGEALREPRCAFHHKLKSRREKPGAALEAMPESTRVERNAKHHRRYKLEKRAYVDEIKLRIGACEGCARPVTKATCTGFEFAHVDETQKEYNVARLKSNGLSLASTIPLIDTEVARCRLLCSCCHKLETDAQRLEEPFAFRRNLGS